MTCQHDVDRLQAEYQILAHAVQLTRKALDTTALCPKCYCARVLNRWAVCCEEHRQLHEDAEAAESEALVILKKRGVDNVGSTASTSSSKENVMPGLIAYARLYQKPGPMIHQFIEELEKRNQKGIKTYGTPLQTFNGRNALQDALEEALDACQYLWQHMREKGKHWSAALDTAIQLTLYILMEMRSDRQ